MTDCHTPNPMGPANLEWQSRVDSLGACLDTLLSNPILPNVEVSADDAARLCVEGVDDVNERLVA